MSICRTFVLGTCTVKLTMDHATARIRARAFLVVDIAGVMFMPANEADRRIFRDRDIDHPFGHMPDGTVGDRVDTDTVTGRKTAGI